MNETKQMYHKNSCQARHIRPLAGFQRGWPDISGPRPEHVWVSEGIGLPIYQLIYRLGQPIFGRFRPVFTGRHRFLGRPTRRHAPHPIPGQIRPLFTPPPWFSSAAYPPSCPTQFIGSVADYRPIPTGFHPATTNFGSPGPVSTALSIGANGE
jgi:hypothetical protein